MSTNYTENFDLCQWEPTDPVIRTNFNADNAKVDAALAGRNCRLYLGSYTGSGTSTPVLNFPHKPVVVFMMDGINTWACGIQGCQCLNLRYSTAFRAPAAVWEGNSLTWNPEQTDPYVSGIVEGRTYLVAALLDMDQ